MQVHSVVVVILVMTVGLFIGRQAGWFCSKALLYPSPTALTAILCVAWGGAMAYATRVLIQSQHLGTIPGVITYAAAAYVSIPNYGLFAEHTIPSDAQAKHHIITVVSLVTFLVASILFAFFIEVGR
jgi:hypothetical protein